nr:malate dehydrogenase [Flavobacteriales bacterium]
VFPCCVWLQGEYGLKDIYMGAPVILGRNGVERIIELKLNKEEQELCNSSAVAVKEVMEVMDKMNVTA